MSDYPTLRKPPIREAVIALRMTPICGEGKDELLQVVPDSIRKAFPQEKERRQYKATFGAKEVPVAQSLDALIFENSETSRNVAIGRLTFSASALAGSYTTFDDLLKLFREHWEAVISRSKPDRILQVSARFINEITVPLGVDLDDYFTIGPRIPDGFPENLSGFSYHCEIPLDHDSRVRVVLRSGNRSETLFQVLLDIDAVEQREYSPDSDALWEAFGRIRVIKNKAFFGSVTPTTIEAYA